MEAIRITSAMKQPLETRRIELDKRIATLKRETEGRESPDDAALLHRLERERDEIASSLAHATLLDDEPFDTAAIEVGDAITIQADGGEPERYVLVEGKFGGRVHDNWVSVSSPLGGALLGRSRGDRIVVETPARRTSYVILDFERSSHEAF